MKKILKDRVKPFAVVVEESLKQAAHMLSSPAWCLPEKGFYHSVFGTSINLKWATTTVGKWCPFWLGRVWRAPAAESRVHLLKASEIDSDTGLSKASQQSCREREDMALPRSRELGVRAQPAGQRCTDSAVPLCPARRAGHGQRWWWAQTQPRDHQACLCWDRSGASEEVPPGGGLSTDTPQLRDEACAAQGPREVCPGCECTPDLHEGSKNMHREFGSPMDGDLHPSSEGEVLVLEQRNSWGRRFCQHFWNCPPQFLSPGQHLPAALILWQELVRELGTKHEVTWGDHLLQWGMQWSRIIPLLTAKKWDLLSTW